MASRQLHASLLLSVLRSPISFFEVTPSGNLLNRFSRDVDAIDCMVPDGLKMMLSYLFKLFEVLVILLLATPLAGLVILPLVFLYVFIQVTFFFWRKCSITQTNSEDFPGTTTSQLLVYKTCVSFLLDRFGHLSNTSEMMSLINV